GRLRRARRLPECFPQPAVGPDRDALPFDLARQQQGQVPTGLATALRSEEDHRRRVRLPSLARRSAQSLVPWLMPSAHPKADPAAALSSDGAAKRAARTAARLFREHYATAPR